MARRGLAVLAALALADTSAFTLRLWAPDATRPEQGPSRAFVPVGKLHGPRPPAAQAQRSAAATRGLLTLRGSSSDPGRQPRRRSGMRHGKLQPERPPQPPTPKGAGQLTEAPEKVPHHFFWDSELGTLGASSAVPETRNKSMPAPDVVADALLQSGKVPALRASLEEDDGEEERALSLFSAWKAKKTAIQELIGVGGADDGAPGASTRTGRFRVVRSDGKEKKQKEKERQGEKLKDVVNRKGSLQAGYRVLDRLEQDGAQISAKFFSMLMSLCVANIRADSARLSDAYGVMQRCRDAGVVPDTILYNALLAAVSQEAARGRATLADATSVMRQLREAGLRPNERTMNTLMDVTAKVAAAAARAASGDVSARSEGDEPAPVTPMSGESILRLMRSEGLSPSAWTYTSLLSLFAQCARRGAGQVSLSYANKVRAEMEAEGIAPTVPLVNNYMTLLSKLAPWGEADLSDAFGLLQYADDHGLAPDRITLNALLSVAAGAGACGRVSWDQVLSAFGLFRQHNVSPDLISYNSALHALACCSDKRRAPLSPVQEGLKLLAWMDKEGVQPDVVTFASLLHVCARATSARRGSVQDADGVMQLMRSRHMLAIDTVLCNTFLDCARADGSLAALEIAELLLAQMTEQDCDSYTYSSIMLLWGKALGREGGAKALALLREISLETGSPPNCFLYNAAMEANLPHSPRSVLDLEEEMETLDVEADRRTIVLVREARTILDVEGVAAVVSGPSVDFASVRIEAED